MAMDYESLSCRCLTSARFALVGHDATKLVQTSRVENPSRSQAVARAIAPRVVAVCWDVEGLTPPRLLRGHRSLVFGVAWSPDGRWLASSGLDNAVRMWDATTAEARQVLQDPDHSDT